MNCIVVLVIFLLLYVETFEKHLKNSKEDKLIFHLMSNIILIQFPILSSKKCSKYHFISVHIQFISHNFAQREINTSFRHFSHVTDKCLFILLFIYNPKYQKFPS